MKVSSVKISNSSFVKQEIYSKSLRNSGSPLVCSKYCIALRLFQYQGGNWLDTMWINRTAMNCLLLIYTVMFTIHAICIYIHSDVYHTRYMYFNVIQFKVSKYFNFLHVNRKSIVIYTGIMYCSIGHVYLICMEALGAVMLLTSYFLHRSSSLHTSLLLISDF